MVAVVTPDAIQLATVQTARGTAKLLLRFERQAGRLRAIDQPV